MVWAGGVEPPEARLGPSNQPTFRYIIACVDLRFTKPGPTPTPASPCTFRVTFASMLTSIFTMVGHRLGASHATTTMTMALLIFLAKL